MSRTAAVAATVSWEELSAAIGANPSRAVRPLAVGSASGTVALLGEGATPILPGWTEDTTQTVADVVSLVLWVREPMYRGAAAGVRRAMESEEAGALLEGIDAAWRTHNGRRRGWVRKHLEEDLRGRSAGADPAAEFWESVRTVKRTALLMDYVCMVRGVRVALWSAAQERVTVIPMTAGAGGSAPTFIQFATDSARVLIGPGSSGYQLEGGATAWPALLESSSFRWVPPVSVPSAGAQTVAQIQEALEALGSGSSSTKKRSRGEMWTSLQWAMFVRDLAGLLVPPSEDSGSGSG
jgi:hypothetical protein